MTAIAYPVSSVSASMLGAAPMMADTPQIPTPTESRLPSFSGRRNHRAKSVTNAMEKRISTTTMASPMPPSRATSVTRNRAPMSTMPTFRKNSYEAMPGRSSFGSGTRLPMIMPPTMAMMTLEARDLTQLITMTAWSQSERSFPPMARAKISTSPGRSRTAASMNFLIASPLPGNGGETGQHQGCQRETYHDGPPIEGERGPPRRRGTPRISVRRGTPRICILHVIIHVTGFFPRGDLPSTGGSGFAVFSQRETRGRPVLSPRGRTIERNIRFGLSAPAAAGAHVEALRAPESEPSLESPLDEHHHVLGKLLRRGGTAVQGHGEKDRDQHSTRVLEKARAEDALARPLLQDLSQERLDACEQGIPFLSPLLRPGIHESLLTGIDAAEDLVAPQAEDRVAEQCFEPEQRGMQAVHVLLHVPDSPPLDRVQDVRVECFLAGEIGVETPHPE